MVRKNADGKKASLARLTMVSDLLTAGLGSNTPGFSAEEPWRAKKPKVKNKAKRKKTK